MELGVLVALLATSTVLVLALRAAVDRTPNAFSGRWSYRELGWPSGVQEDDDLQWSWTRAALASRVAAPRQARVVAGDGDAVERPPALEVRPTPLRYEVRSAEDRARS